METISLKMEHSLLREIDGSLKRHRYGTRTEFIRDAIRSKLKEIETEEVLKRIAAFRGSMKGKAKMGDEEAGELAFRAIAKKHGIPLD